MARVSSDHADEKLCAQDLLEKSEKSNDEMRQISVKELEKHNGQNRKDFWGVVDGCVKEKKRNVAKHKK